MLLYVSLAMPFCQFTVSENKHYILRDGKPFFWLGDTGWELFHRLDRDQVAYYLKRGRARFYRYTGSGACGV